MLKSSTVLPLAAFGTPPCGNALGTYRLQRSRWSELAAGVQRLPIVRIENIMTAVDELPIVAFLDGDLILSSRNHL